MTYSGKVVSPNRKIVIFICSFSCKIVIFIYLFYHEIVIFSNSSAMEPSGRKNHARMIFRAGGFMAELLLFLSSGFDNISIPPLK